MPFLTPGAAMSSSLEQILATKKAEARQALLDSLNQKNVESEIRSRDENAKSSALYRQMQGSLYNTQEEQRKVGMIDSSGAGVGSDVTGRFAPDVESVGKQYGRLRNQEVINDEGTDTTPHTFSLGTPKEQEQNRQDEALKALRPSILSHFSPEQQGPMSAMLDMYGAQHQVPPASEMVPFINATQTQDTYVMDRGGVIHKGGANGPVVTSVPKGAPVHTMPAAPSGPAPTQWTGKGDDGKEHTYLLDAKGNVIKELNIDGLHDLRKGNQPTVTTAFHPVIDPTTSRSIAKLYATATTTDNDKDWNAFYSAANAGVSTSRADTGIKAIIAKIIADAQAGHPDPRTTQQIIDASTKNATAQEKKDFSDLLRTIRSEGQETQ